MKRNTGQPLSIHEALLLRNKKWNWPYMSSVLIENKNVPLFEEYFGQLDYDWMLRATKSRVCREIAPCVWRYVNGKNLSLDPDYRKRDFYIGLIHAGNDIGVIKRWYSSHARYHYVMGDMKIARFYFIRGTINWKSILYVVSSYFPILSQWIIKKYRVFN